MVVGVGVSVAEECGEEVDLRGRGFPSLGSYAFAFETDAMSPVLLVPALGCGRTIGVFVLAIILATG